jgi:hypothetical protein
LLRSFHCSFERWDYLIMQKSLIVSGLAFMFAVPNALAASGNVNAIGAQQPKILGPQRQSMGPQQFKPPSAPRPAAHTPASELKSAPRQPRVHPTININPQERANSRAQQSEDRANAAVNAARDRRKAGLDAISRVVDKMRAMPPPKP